MKKLLIILILSIFFNTNLFAVTLEEALLEAYNNNLELNAERKNIEVSKEILKISKSDFFPTLTITGSKNFENTNKLTNQSKLISEEFLFVSSDGDKVYKDEKGLYYFDEYKGEKLYYHPDYPPTKMSGKKVIKSLELTPLQNYIFNYELDISDDVDMKAIKRLKNADDVYNYYANVRGWEGTDLEDDLNNIYDQVKVKFG